MAIGTSANHLQAAQISNRAISPPGQPDSATPGRMLSVYRNSPDNLPPRRQPVIEPQTLNLRYLRHPVLDQVDFQRMNPSPLSSDDAECDRYGRKRHILLADENGTTGF